MSRREQSLEPQQPNPFPDEEEVTTTSYRRLLASLPCTIRCKVGRVIELRLLAMRHADDVADLRARLAAEATSLARPAIICADYRYAMPFPDEVASAWATEMKRLEPLVERSAILLDPTNEPFNLSFARTAEHGGLPSRRFFTSAAELRTWLRPTASDAELSRVERFLR
jgi:hypothetical protein